MRKRILKIYFLFLLMQLLIPFSVMAFDQYESMTVGETKTFYFPSEVTSRASSMYSYNCSSDHINNVEVVSYTNTSVTVKALTYTQYRVNIRFDYWWYENNYGRHDTHIVHIDLNDSGYDGSSSENPWDYNFDYGSWGTINIEVGETKTVYSDITAPNPDKLVSVIWSDYNQYGYEITSQSGSSCTIKGSFEVSEKKLWCLWKYGNSTYKAYYTVNVNESSKETLSLSAEPNGGKINKGTKVYLSASSSGATIYYTTNGNAPTTSSNTYSSSGISINNSCTLKAFAKKSGYNDSPIMTWVYTVEESIPVQSISLNASSVSMNTGKTKQLTATVSPNNATDNSVSWISSNINVATVNSSGLVTAKSEGTATITCRANDGSGVSATCQVTVSPPVIIEINETNFPDANFRKYLLEQSYGKDGFLTTEEIESVLEINVTDYSIKSLEGVEIFTKLRYLYCSNNQLTSLDVSNNTDMLFLECEKNKLTSLDLSNNTQLQAVWCYSNLLTSLDVSNCTSLTKLWCNNNELFSLECSDNSALKELKCTENNISYLDLQRNQELMSLSCSDNKLSSLDVSHNVNLKSLYCKSNLLESLNVSNNTKLETLDCYQNKLVSLDVTNNPNLKNLDCSSNKLTSIDVSKNTSLAQLTCSFNQLTSLIVSNTQLTYLNIQRNQIEGKAMDNLINSLPTNWSNEEYAFKILSGSDDHEKNSCTTSQVAAVKAKGWTPYYFDMGTNPGWKEYSGSDPTGIRNIKKNVNGDNPIFDISGKRLSQPRKGLLIIDGKKVIVR